MKTEHCCESKGNVWRSMGQEVVRESRTFFQCQQPLLNQSVDSNKLLLPPCVVESQLREPVITVSNSSNTTLCQYLEKTGKEKPWCFVEAVAPCELRC